MSNVRDAKAKKKKTVGTPLDLFNYLHVCELLCD